jgi:DNA primase
VGDAVDFDADEILESVDILEYIAQYTDFEERCNGYWALSPLKDEDTPSFHVDKEKQVFYDFSSGQYGDVISFVRAHDGCGFQKAVETLAHYAGLESQGRERVLRHLPCVRVMKRYGMKMKEKKESKATVKPPDHMERYDREPDKLTVWAEEGISREVMERYQVRYDRFANRIVFPIRDINGNIINVSGRTLDPDYKQKKERKYTYYYPLGIFDTLYGFYEHREAIENSGEIILFEGAKSVMLAETWGIKNTAAICTSHLNPYQFKILLGVPARVVFALDKGMDVRDDAQVKKLLRYHEVYTIEDRDELLQDKMAPVDAGREVWEKLYEGRVRLRR